MSTRPKATQEKGRDYLIRLATDMFRRPERRTDMSEEHKERMRRSYLENLIPAFRQRIEYYLEEELRDAKPATPYIN